MLDATDSALEAHVARLFRDYTQNSTVEFGRSNLGSSGLLETGHWERTTQDFLVKPGFALRDERPVKITHAFNLAGYNRPGDTDFSVSISLLWSLETDGYSRVVTVNKAAVSRIGQRIRYAELETRSPRADGASSAILDAAMREIEKLSNTR